MTSAATDELSPADKIAAIQASLRCFTCGLVGLIPVIGFPFALLAIVSSVRLQCRFRRSWNPAGEYQAWGMRLGSVGVVLFFSCAVIFAAFWILHDSRG